MRNNPRWTRMAMQIPRRQSAPPPPAPKPPPSDGTSCPVAPGAGVWIYTFVKEFELVYWLCRRHKTARAAAGESCRGMRCPPNDSLYCFDCHFDGRA